MTELILNIGKRISKADSLGLTVVYTIGHIFIATICVYLITGAPLNLAAADAFIEPMINGIWFYLLFEVFSKYQSKTKAYSGKTDKSPAPAGYQKNKLAPVNNKKNID